MSLCEGVSYDMTVLKIQGQKVLYRSKHTEYCEHQIFTVLSFHQLFYCLSHETLKQGRAGPTCSPPGSAGGQVGGATDHRGQSDEARPGTLSEDVPAVTGARRGEGRGAFGVFFPSPPLVWALICPVQEGCQPFPPPAPRLRDTMCLRWG